MLRSALKVAFGVTQFGCACHCVLKYIGTVSKCAGDSMIPTLHPGDWIVCECNSVNQHSLQRGDVVVSLSKTNPSMFVCKRITAMEGDEVDTSDDNKEYVPKGHVWLEGDNKEVSIDSRKYGAVPYGLIYCRVAYKIFSAKKTVT